MLENNAPTFIPGAELSRRFYVELVRPILERRYADLPHAAAHLGNGSDVLGFNTEMSRDHDWGPTVTLLLRDADTGLADAISETLRHELPHMFYGYPVGMAVAAENSRVAVMDEANSGPVMHRISVLTVRQLAQYALAYDIDQAPDAADWLTFPTQLLLSITAGPVFSDNVGELTALRERLAYYPHDVWLYLLAAGWTRIGEEEHLAPRAGYVGDELGAALIGSRLVRDVMNLCFLMERRYAPYPKWFGSAFRRLACAAELAPLLWQAQTAPNWQEREAALAQAYEYIARMHNALGITRKLRDTTTNFYDRPFAVIHGDHFAAFILSRITNPEVKRITARKLIGSIDQFSDSTDLRADVSWRQKLRALYE